MVIRDRAAGEEWKLAARAVFVMVGAAPNTGWLDGRVKMDDKGYVLTGDCGRGGRAVCHLLPRHLRGGRRARGVGQAGGLVGGRGIGGDFRGVAAPEPALSWLYAAGAAAYNAAHVFGFAPRPSNYRPGALILQTPGQGA